MSRRTVLSGEVFSGVPAGSFGPATMGATLWLVPQPVAARARANAVANMADAAKRIGARVGRYTEMLLDGVGRAGSKAHESQELYAP